MKSDVSHCYFTVKGFQSKPSDIIQRGKNDLIQQGQNKCGAYFDVGCSHDLPGALGRDN